MIADTQESNAWKLHLGRISNRSYNKVKTTIKESGSLMQRGAEKITVWSGNLSKAPGIWPVYQILASGYCG